MDISSFGVFKMMESSSAMLSEIGSSERSCWVSDVPVGTISEGGVSVLPCFFLSAIGVGSLVDSAFRFDVLDVNWSKIELDDCPDLAFANRDNFDVA